MSDLKPIPCHGCSKTRIHACTTYCKVQKYPWHWCEVEKRNGAECLAEGHMLLAWFADSRGTNPIQKWCCGMHANALTAKEKSESIYRLETLELGAAHGYRMGATA